MAETLAFASLHVLCDAHGTHLACHCEEFKDGLFVALEAEVATIDSVGSAGDAGLGTAWTIGLITRDCNSYSILEVGVLAFFRIRVRV